MVYLLFPRAPVISFPIHEIFDYKNNSAFGGVTYFNKDQSLGIFLEIHVAGTKGGFCVQKPHFLGERTPILDGFLFPTAYIGSSAAPTFEII